jgi:hypothetical protein
VREEAEKCNCEARTKYLEARVEGGGRIYGGDKGLVTCDDIFFLYMRVWSVFCWKIWFLLFITGCIVVAILVVYFFGFIR